MATASGSPSRKHKLKKQVSQSSITTQESSDMTCYIDTDIDTIMNKRWEFDEVAELLRSQLALLPGGRDKNGGAIIIMEGSEGQDYTCNKVGRILSYLSKIPEETVQSKGFTVVLDMRGANWSQAKKALEALKWTFVEHINEVIVMRPKSFWQRGKSSVSFNFNKSKYGFKCVMLEHSADLFQHLSLAQVPKAQNGQSEYNHTQWMDIRKSTEAYYLQLMSRKENYLVLQETLHYNPQIKSLNDARDAVKHHVNMKSQLDRSLVIDISETVAHSVSRLRPLTSNPDFEEIFVKLEDLSGQLHTLFSQLELLWERKGESLDRILQFKIFEADTAKQEAWLQEKYNEICKGMTDVGQEAEEAEENKAELDSFRLLINSQHQDIDRTIKMGERLIAFNHPESTAIELRCNQLGEKWEMVNEVVEERMGMMFLAVNFYSKQDKFLQSSESWIDQCGSRTKPLEVKDCEVALEAHKAIRESFSSLYFQAKQDGHSLIEKLRKPVGNQGVPRSFTLTTRNIKECLEQLYDEKTLVDDQWQARQEHLTKTMNLRIYQRDTSKIFKWIAEVGNHFLLTNTLIGSDADSATKLLKLHDSFESSSELPVVYSQANLLQTRSLELISGKDCRIEEVEEEAKKLEDKINLFASHLDERREILVLSVECFKACNNFLGELNSIKKTIPREKFEGNLNELEERLARFKTHRDIIRKISQTTYKMWSSLLERVTCRRELDKEGDSIDYSIATTCVRENIQLMEETQQRVDGICQQRENHWSLSIERHTIITKMAKHLEQLESWLQEQSIEKELADTLAESELQRDIFQRQYLQQKEESDLLIERGMEINDYLGKLDVLMFGVGVVTGVTMKEQVEIEIVKVEKGKDGMRRRADPHLKSLNECALYYKLESDSKKLIDSLKQLSATLNAMQDITHSIEESSSVQQSLQETEDQFNEISSEVESFLATIRECEATGHYQSPSLSIFGRTVQEKSNSVAKVLKDKKRIVKGSTDFHKNYDKLKATADHCLTQFSSRDTGSSHNQIEFQQETMKEMRMHLEEAVEVVKSHADQLITVLGKTQNTLSKKGSYEDVKTPTNDSAPRLLVTPRKVRQEKASSPGPSAATGQLILEGLLKEMDTKVAKAFRMWETRNVRLEQCKQVILFEEEVPKVLDWLDKVGMEFIASHRDYGRSIEDVQKLIEEYSQYSSDKMAPMTEQVTRLRDMMKEFEEMGHYELNRIRSIGNHLEQKWEKFETEINTYSSNLKLSLEFQEKLFDGSNWCMQSEQFLQSLDDRVNSSELSEEVGSLTAELSVFLLVTQGEQLERVARIKEISSSLHSNVLVEMSQQLDSSTHQMIRDFESAKQELQTLYSKLVHIEEEKDKEMRTLKQRERVVEELMNTEEAYVQDLKLVVDTCKPRFISDFLPDSLRGKETLVFGNIQWIAEFHIETLLPSLLAADRDIDRIAQVFIDNVDILTDLYVPYCKNKTASEELLASHRSYLSRVQSLFGTDYPLSSLLIKPIQRITKYPLLLKDALKYQKKLNLPCEKLEIAILAVEETPVQTNNAINLSLLQSDEGLNWHKYGELLHQGSLLVSEPRLLITSEKERQVFVFENTVAFARKIELGQAKFKYDYKFRIPITAGVQVLEFFEGEPCKFALFTSDHRMHFRAATVPSKQRWVRHLRTAIHKHVQEEDVTRVRSMTETTRHRSNAVMTGDRAAMDLKERRRSPVPTTHRPSSPFSKSRVNLIQSHNTETPIGSPVGFEVYKVIADYEPFPDDHHGISLKKDQKVEVMEELEGGRCFMRATTITGQVEHGWAPMKVLEGPLPPDILFNDDEQLPFEDTDNVGHLELRRATSATTTTSSASSQKVISTLKKVTLGEDLQSKPSPKSSPKSSPNLGKKSPGGRMSPLVEQKQMSVAPPRSPGLDRRSVSPQPPPSPGFQTFNNKQPTSPVRIKLARKGVVRKPSKNVTVHPNDEGKELEQTNTESATSPEAEEETKKMEEELERERKKSQAEQKLQYIMAELVETEQEYVAKLDKLVNGYLKEMQQSTELPESLVGKDKIIFGNVEAIYEFHKDVFKNLLEENKDSLESIAKCFLDKRAEFGVYVTYCENKPKSESFIWTYTHSGGTFFKEMQEELKLREDIASFLIKPVQRITKYQLLLRDLFLTSQKLDTDNPMLEKSLQLMKDVPKQANDAMALSMIVGYPGNIHANGEIVIQDEFTVYEKSRWAGGARRQLFLLDRVIIITKEKDNDGLYVFKDSLKVHNIFISELSECRFNIGTGSISNPDSLYILEAPSPEKKQDWTKIIKDLLNQQFEMLKALKQPNRNRQSTIDDSSSRLSKGYSFSLDDISDSEDDSDAADEVMPSPLVARKRSSALVQDDDNRKFAPFTISKSPSASPGMTSMRTPRLYIAGDDCAPPVEGQKILHLRKGQIYDILNQSGDWWLGRLVRDTSRGCVSRGTEGWIPSTFMDLFQGQLSYEEEVYLKWGEGKGNKGDMSKFSTLPTRLRESSPASSNNGNRLSMFPFGKSDEKKKKDANKTPKSSQRKSKAAQGPKVVTQISNETVISGQDVQFSCVLAEAYSDIHVEWQLNGNPLKRDNAFTSSGKTCALKIQEVSPCDEGVYTCRLTLPNNEGASSTARLTVLGPPNPPGKPSVHQITSTSVSLSWGVPNFDGHSQITVYIVECKDTQSTRWSTLMKRITDPATIVSDLVPGTEYVFRVLASNSIGSSDASNQSHPFYLNRQRSDLQSVFSLEPFDNQYTLANVLARGQFSSVYECLHDATQQSYVAKLIPLSIGREHAYNELSILSRINHPNIVQMTSAYLTSKHYVIVLQYVQGVPLLEYLVSRHRQASSVILMQCVFAILSGLAYLHEMEVAHLAVRPSNIIVREKVNGALVVKLVHFSHSKDMSSADDVISTPSDTHLEYNAPEVLLCEPVTTATDMWSVGVLLYTLITGTPPFVVGSVDLTKVNIREAKVNLSSRVLKGLLEEPKKLIKSLLQKEQNARPSAEACLQEVWLHTGLIGLNGVGKVVDLSRLKGHLERTTV